MAHHVDKTWGHHQARGVYHLGSVGRFPPWLANGGNPVALDEQVGPTTRRTRAVDERAAGYPN